MATDVIMPALGMAQETGRLLAWRKAEGETVTRGEPLFEVETDKVTVEIEAEASGVLARVAAGEGDDVPVGRVIAVILAAGEGEVAASPVPAASPATLPSGNGREAAPLNASPVAQRIAAEHGLDLRAVKPAGGRMLKEDVLAFLARRGAARLRPASPKARRLAAERGLELAELRLKAGRPFARC